MPAPLHPDQRAAIADAIRGGGARNAIAREHGVSPSTVTKIAHEEHIEHAFDRAQTKRATEARTVDMAAERARLAGLLMADTFALRERMWGTQYQAVVVPMKGGGASTEVIAVPTSAADFRNYATSIAVLVDKVGVLTRDDSEGLAAVDSWLRSVVGGG